MRPRAARRTPRDRTAARRWGAAAGRPPSPRLACRLSGRDPEEGFPGWGPFSTCSTNTSRRTDHGVALPIRADRLPVAAIPGPGAPRSCGRRLRTQLQRRGRNPGAPVREPLPAAAQAAGRQWRAGDPRHAPPSQAARDRPELPDRGLTMRYRIVYRCGQSNAFAGWLNDAFRIVLGMAHLTPMWFDVID